LRLTLWQYRHRFLTEAATFMPRVCVDTIEDGVDDKMDGVVKAGRIR